ncbi:MAG: hypothetical protein HC932_05950 [Thermales bacterium]|nr:hypothetical protein [Thermales bacterium]
MSITDTMYYYLPKFNQRTLQGEEAGHFFTTRVQEGDELDVCDQSGSIGKIVIDRVDKKKKEIRYSLVGYETLARRGPSKILFQAIPDKQYLDKLVELLPLADIDRLFLFESQYSPKYNINWERLKKNFDSFY